MCLTQETSRGVGGFLVPGPRADVVGMGDDWDFQYGVGPGHNESASLHLTSIGGEREGAIVAVIYEL